MVMLRIALPTFGKWLCLFVPTLFVFGFAIYVLAQPSGLGNGFVLFFNSYMLGGFDTTNQPFKTVVAVQATANADSSGARQFFYVVILIGIILVSGIALVRFCLCGARTTVDLSLDCSRRFGQGGSFNYVRILFPIDAA
jgi:hypothetical protein